MLRYVREGSGVLTIAGSILLMAGIVFYLSTVRLLIKGLKETRLMTTGTYGLCQHPLYASFILMIIPALSLLLNSWLILTSGIVGYIIFRRRIRQEYAELEKVFGDDYVQYRKRTPEFFPFPVKKPKK
jgi:protein-S-isoprenylcysteine O-methyltransferase Ste14